MDRNRILAILECYQISTLILIAPAFLNYGARPGFIFFAKRIIQRKIKSLELFFNGEKLAVYKNCAGAESKIKKNKR